MSSMPFLAEYFLTLMQPPRLSGVSPEQQRCLCLPVHHAQPLSAPAPLHAELCSPPQPGRSPRSITMPLADLPCRHSEQLIWSWYLCRPINHSAISAPREAAIKPWERSLGWWMVGKHISLQQEQGWALTGRGGSFGRDVLPTEHISGVQRSEALKCRGIFMSEFPWARSFSEELRVEKGWYQSSATCNPCRRSWSQEVLFLPHYTQCSSSCEYWQTKHSKMKQIKSWSRYE